MHAKSFVKNCLVSAEQCGLCLPGLDAGKCGALERQAGFERPTFQLCLTLKTFCRSRRRSYLLLALLPAPRPVQLAAGLTDTPHALERVALVPRMSRRDCQLPLWGLVRCVRKG